uniref:Uncharacterized protein n=1 Tax=Fagus sylvatica TaxID=28930 RepID=A0A2N9HVA6_FAGSY
MNNHISFPHIKNASDDASTPQETANTMRPVFERGSNNVRTQGVHSGHALNVGAGPCIPSVHGGRLIPPPTGDQSSAASYPRREDQVINLIEPQENALASARFELNVLALEAQLEKAITNIASPKFDLNAPAPETFLNLNLNMPPEEDA